MEPSNSLAGTPDVMPRLGIAALAPGAEIHCRRIGTGRLSGSRPARTIAGHTREMIIRSGFNGHPAEVEGVLNAHPAVVRSAVVGRPVDGNEEVGAFVQLLSGAARADELMRYAAEQLTAYKRPSEFVCLDTLPSRSMGKILKHRLAESAGQPR
jgi:acyl-CoA synthetase (AMP-forming)/AMP-acid ligase II